MSILTSRSPNPRAPVLKGIPKLGTLSPDSKKGYTTRTARSALLLKANLYTFGVDAPKITISSSRRPLTKDQNTPGPGEYNVNFDKLETKLQTRISSSRVEDTKRSLTADIGFLDRPEFVNKENGKTIGVREKFELGPIAPGPGPGKYALPSSMDNRTHLITSRHNREKINENPGPGTYDPPLKLFDLHSKGPVPYVNVDRTEWMVKEMERTPAPTDYNPMYNDSKAPIGSTTIHGKIHTSIGQRHRGKKMSNGSNVIAVGQCIVKLDKVPDPQEARRYIQKSKGLNRVVKEIYDLILLEKPDSPLEFIKEHFLPEASPEEEDEIKIFLSSSDSYSD